MKLIVIAILPGFNAAGAKSAPTLAAGRMGAHPLAEASAARHR
ncbi:hypothetical protein [Mesorhizobium sp.]|nr:hypothetical protein [Mesorhizobium sp.]